MLRKSLDQELDPAVSVFSASRWLGDPGQGAGPLWAVIIIASSSHSLNTFHGPGSGLNTFQELAHLVLATDP